jgi:hypothetical protein
MLALPACRHGARVASYHLPARCQPCLGGSSARPPCSACSRRAQRQRHACSSWHRRSRGRSACLLLRQQWQLSSSWRAGSTPRQALPPASAPATMLQGPQPRARSLSASGPEQRLQAPCGQVRTHPDPQPPATTSQPQQRRLSQARRRRAQPQLPRRRRQPLRRAQPRLSPHGAPLPSWCRSCRPAWCMWPCAPAFRRVLQRSGLLPLLPRPSPLLRSGLLPPLPRPSPLLRLPRRWQS